MEQCGRLVTSRLPCVRGRRQPTVACLTLKLIVTEPAEFRMKALLWVDQTNKHVALQTLAEHLQYWPILIGKGLDKVLLMCWETMKPPSEGHLKNRPGQQTKPFQPKLDTLVVTNTMKHGL
jgi:hypothetical protein